jgi:lauroyl/myristoyl acyltransferase
MPALKSGDLDLDEILQELEDQRTLDLRVDHRSPFLWLYANPKLHRLVPDGVALAAAALAGRIRWLWPPSRRRAIARISLIVAHTPRAGEVKKLARRELVSHAVATEIQVRPWMMVNARVEDREHLVEAAESTRPTIVMIAHFGGAGSQPIKELGRPVYAIAHPFLNPRLPGTRAGWWAYKARLGWERLRTSPLRLVFRGNAYATLEALLERGEVVVIALDVPGSMKTTMAGKTAYLGSGLANLAKRTDALVVPLFGRLEKRRPVIRLAEAIDPRDFAGPQELLDCLAGLMTDEILRAPEHVDPNLFWPEIWRDDSAALGLEPWKRGRPIRDFRRRLRGKLRYIRSQLPRARPAG